MHTCQLSHFRQESYLWSHANLFLQTNFSSLGEKWAIAALTCDFLKIYKEKQSEPMQKRRVHVNDHTLPEISNFIRKVLKLRNSENLFGTSLDMIGFST